MPKVTAATLAVTALMLITLTGCASAAGDAGDERTAPAASESAAPLVAETPAPSDPGGDDAEQAFLDYVRENLPTPTSIPDATDEQLLTAGEDACSRLAAGEPADGMVVVDGEQPWENGYYYDSSAIVGGASRYLCDA